MVLNLESFRETILAESQRDVETTMGTIRLRRLTQDQLVRLRPTLPTKEGEELTPDAIVQIGVEVIALTAVDDSGVAYLDTDEGRELIHRMSAGDLNAALKVALSMNGIVAFDGEENEVATETKKK